MCYPTQEDYYKAKRDLNDALDNIRQLSRKNINLLMEIDFLKKLRNDLMDDKAAKVIVKEVIQVDNNVGYQLQVTDVQQTPSGLVIEVN